MSRRNWVLPAFGTFKSVAPSASTPRAFPAVKVRVLRAFYGNKRLLEVGEVVALPEPSARDAVALKRAEMV